MKHSFGLHILLAAALATAVLPAFAADNLKLNPHLDYSSDSIDGPLITGSSITAGIQPGVPNYVIIYGEGCYNSKRQARRTVSLYDRYKVRVHFVVIDLDQPHVPAQQQLIDTYYRDSIPDLIILDTRGKPIYNQAGEQDEAVLARYLDQSLQ